MDKNIAVIILAAGKSTRMKSETPKVLHRICGRPMLEYVLDLVESLKIKNTVAVLGHKQEILRRYIRPGTRVAVQKRLLGTADAIKSAMPLLKSFKGTVLILYADNPLLKKETIKNLLEQHAKNNADATLLTAVLDKPSGYGRILRDEYSGICDIREEKDADEAVKEIKEINTGIMCLNKEKLSEALKLIRPDNKKREYYLTDCIGIFYGKGYLVEGVKITDTNEALGINSRQELAKANKVMQMRIHEALMKKGVSIVDPDNTFINFAVKIGEDSTIYPFTVIENNVKIGKCCRVGPFSHVREGTVLSDGVAVGNFCEIVRSKISSGTKAKHISYIGDARIGKSVNIGAGTVIANYDGKNKNLTVIKDGAFIGSDTVLVAPVLVGKGARTGAGSVVIKNTKVKDGTTVVGVPARQLKK